MHLRLDSTKNELVNTFRAAAKLLHAQIANSEVGCEDEMPIFVPL